MKEGIRYIGEFRAKDKELSPPSGIAMDNSGNIIISDEFNHRIQICDAAGSPINSIGKKGNGGGEFYYPKGIAIDSEGAFYVADCWNHRVQKFSRGAHESGSWKPLSSFGSYGDAPGSFNEPYDIAILKGQGARGKGREDRIFVLDRCNHRIQVFDKNAALRGIIGQRGTVIEEDLAELFDTPPPLFSFPAFEFPTGLALDSEGNIYVADSGNHRIVKLNSEGEVLLTFGQKGGGAKEFQYPHDIAIDDKGTIFVSDLNNNRIQAFTPEGELAFSIDTGKDNSDKISSPTALLIDNRGRLYAGMGFDTRILIYEYKMGVGSRESGVGSRGAMDISSISREIREVEDEISKIKEERLVLSDDYIARQIKRENDVSNPPDDDIVFDETLYSYEKRDRSLIRDMRHKLLIHKRLVTKSCDLLSQDNENIKDYTSLLINESRFLLGLLEERRNRENEAEVFFRDESRSKEENWKGFKIAIRKSDIVQDILPHIFSSLNLLITGVKKPLKSFGIQPEERYIFAKIILYSSGMWDYILQVEESIKELMGMSGENVPLTGDEGNKPLPIPNLPITLTLADLTAAIFLEGRAIANRPSSLVNYYEAMEPLKVKLEKLLEERERIGEEIIKLENSIARLPMREEKMRLPVLNNRLLMGFHDRINHRHIGELLTAYQILSSMLIGISDKEMDKKIPEIMKFNEAQIALTSKIKKQGNEEGGRYRAELDRIIFSLNSDKNREIELKNAIFRTSRRTGFAHLYSKRMRGGLTLYRQYLKSLQPSAFSLQPKFDMSFGNYGKGKGEFNLPGSIEVDKGGNLYITDQNNHRIQKFDRDGKFMMSFGGFGSLEGRFKMPVGIAFDRDGNLLVSEWHNNRIQRFSPDGEFISSFGRQGGREGEFNRPSGIAVDKDGFIYVADLGNRRIQKFSHDGKHISSLGNGTFKEPYAVCIIPSPLPLTKGGEGGFVVGELAGDRAIILDGNGNIFKSFGGEGTEDGKFLWIGSITNDKKGSIYIADFWNSRIQIFSKDFNFISSLGKYGRGAGEFDGAPSIAITDEFLYACDYFNHRIQRFKIGNL
jgi:DNA-binding beta-propeller fold protein YncE